MIVLADCLAEHRAIGGAHAQSYRIPPHVHVCVTGDGSVILDLKRDKYFGVGRDDTEVLAAAVRGWPVPSWVRALDEKSLKEGAERVCRSMVEERLLVSKVAPAAGRDAEECGREHDHEHVGEQVGERDVGGSGIRIDMRAPFVSVGDELEVGAEIRPSHVARLAVAYTWATYSLRRRPLDVTVAAIRSRKERRLASGAGWDLLRLARSIDIFRRLRPYVFAAEGRCLLHAVTLVKFLSSHDVYPEWVIGVATQPWAAHSWVQWGNYLLDTNPEKVCRYTPILVV
jgi:hypothetical protein